MARKLFPESAMIVVNQLTIIGAMIAGKRKQEHLPNLGTMTLLTVEEVSRVLLGLSHIKVI